MAEVAPYPGDESLAVCEERSAFSVVIMSARELLTDILAIEVPSLQVRHVKATTTTNFRFFFKQQQQCSYNCKRCK